MTEHPLLGLSEKYYYPGEFKFSVGSDQTKSAIGSLIGIS